MSQGLASGMWEAFLNFMYRSGDIKVSTDFHDRCSEIYKMMDNDISGIVSTVIDYSINSSSEAILKVECSDETLEKILNIWLSKINININGVPSGLQELAKDYYKERWAGSSLCLMRVGAWENITVGKTTISVPTLLYFVNGASVYIKRKNPKNFKIGTDKYFLDEHEEISIPKDNEDIIVQKPFSRWFTKYPSPYLVKKGVLKNWMAMEVLASKGDEVISKVLPYLFLITKGDKDAFLKKDVDYSDTELTTLVENFTKAANRYTNEKGKVPANAIPFDQKYEHLIPDLLPVLKEELYRQGYRAMMAGLGFVDMLEITPSRQETRLNPKPFIGEINAGVSDFKSMLLDVIRLIIDENKLDHKKLFSDNKVLKVVNSPLKINIDMLRDQFRSAFVYGTITIETFQESLGIDPEQELQRMKREWNDGLRDIYYAHVIQNNERDPDNNIKSVPITKKEIEKKEEKEQASEKLLVKCSKCGTEFDYLSVKEAGMGWIKCPNCEEAVTQEDLIIAPYTMDNYPKYLNKYPKDAIKVWVEVFNKTLKDTGDESKAFPYAWTALKRYLKKNYVKQPDGTYKKKE